VRVDRDDPDAIAIDWDAAATLVGSGRVHGEVLAVEVRGRPAHEVEERFARAKAEIRSSGLPATVTVAGFRDLGETIGERRVVQVALRVEVDGRPPYDVDDPAALHPDAIALMHPGAVFAAEVSPDDPRAIAIDWESGPR
jgi:hypothetical protein